MAHGFLSYQDTRGEVDYLGGIVNAVKKYLDNREKKEQVADMVAAKINVEDKETAALEAGKSAPRLPVGAQKMLTGGSYSKLASRNPKALPGAVATNPEVRGGAITRMGFGGKRLKPEGFVGDQIIDISATPVNDSNQIVQAIDRLTFVSMNLLSATKEQTAIAQRQQLFFEKLARKDKASIEEAELERRKNVSGNLPYDRSPLASGRLLPPAGGTGGSRRDMGDFLKTAARRGVSANKAGAQAIAKGGRFGAIKLAQMGAKNPLKAYNMMPKMAQSASDLLFGTKRAAPIVKKLAVGAKVGKEAVTAGAAAGKAIKAGVSPSVANKITKKTPPALLKLLAGSEEVDGIRRLSNVAAGVDDGANAAKLTSRLLAEGYDKPQVAKIVADQFPNAGKVLSESVTSTATAKLASKTVGKGIGKSILKKIPVIAGLAGIAFGVQRALEGDFLGAGLEIASGVMGATGVGAGASLGIDGFLLARDLGVTPFATGGIITKPTMGLVGETGQAEGVFPLEGSRGRKTFEMFGNAFVDAQKRRIREVAQIQSAGLEEFAKKKDNGFFSWLFGGGNNDNTPPANNGDGRAAWDPLGLFTGNRNNNGGAESRTPMVGPPPPVTGTGDLFDVIASGEGGYESVNRGVAGDTPGGAESVTGKKLSDMTVGEVMELQAQEKLFAVGKYQIIPKTMRGFVRTMNISMDDKFDAATQEKFKKYVIDFKRPIVGRYLRGETNDRTEAAQELAREFASIGLAYDEAGRVRGESRYSGTAGNAASISPAEIEAALDRGRAGQTQDYDPNKTYKTGDVVKKNGMLMKFDGFGWAALNDGLQSSNPDVGNDIQLASAETSLAAAANTGGTTIINNYSAGSSDGSTTVGNQVDFGPGNADLGGDLFTNTRIRTLVA